MGDARTADHHRRYRDEPVDPSPRREVEREHLAGCAREDVVTEDRGQALEGLDDPAQNSLTSANRVSPGAHCALGTSTIA